MNRVVRLSLGAGIAVAVVASLPAANAVAWGDGRVCLDGVTHTFGDEPSYFAFLADHPAATEGACAPATTTTTTEVPPSTTTTSEPPPSDSTTPPTNTPETTNPGTSAVDSTTSTPQPSTTAVSPPSTDPGALIPPATSPPAAGESSTTTTSTPTGELPATGGDVNTPLAVGGLLTAFGVTGVLIARRRS